MRTNFSLLWSWNRTIDRLPYLLTGAILMLVKFGVDWTIATQGFGHSWSPFNYVIWPDYAALRVYDLPEMDRLFSLTLLVVSLPFIWVGVILTVQRLRAAGLPMGLVLLFFVPFINLLLFLILILAPTKPVVLEAMPLEPRPGLQRVRAKHRQVTQERVMSSAVLAVMCSVPLTVAFVILGATTLKSYGFGLFVGSPFFLGLFSVVLFGLSRPQRFGDCMVVAMTASSLAGLVVLVIAIEGLICLLMAAPIAYAVAFLGALVGYAIQARPWLSHETPVLCLGLLAVLPSLMAAEAANEPEQVLREVRTAVVIDAPPERVWERVIAFPPLAEPDGWFFRTGIAYPQRAEIQGSGVGAVRHCVFSTGTFVEPIELWERPRLLRFRVTDQPCPMREWSPYEIHPAHLDHYLVSRQGQFELEAGPDGRTRLTGTTWYTNRMWPGPYWGLWSDYIIHRIHRRVLEHIRESVLP